MAALDALRRVNRTLLDMGCPYNARTSKEAERNCSDNNNVISRRGEVEGALFPPHRPVTRSQTGVKLSKRTPWDETPPVEKRRKLTSRSKSAIPPLHSSTEFSYFGTPADTSFSRPSKPEIVVASRLQTAPVQDTSLAFLDNDSLSGSPSEHHRPRTRVALPNLVPNLTKKSRGRRVPTKDASDTYGDRQQSRLYVCTVESCGKCFHRGEHLKRHIRSIHTDEKPFKCTYPLCEKYFNRHDNLLQHLKVHLDHTPTQTSHLDDNTNSNSHPLIQQAPLHRPSHSPMLQLPKLTSFQSERTTCDSERQTSYNPYPSPVSYLSMLVPAGLVTNMAVSSLRTELPQPSPTSLSDRQFPPS